MKTSKKSKARVRSGYVVEEFSSVSSGYGNLLEERLTAAEAIRHFCIECQGGHYFPWRDSDGSVIQKNIPTEAVEACVSTTCYLYPNRLGHRAPAR